MADATLEVAIRGDEQGARRTIRSMREIEQAAGRVDRQIEQVDSSFERMSRTIGRLQTAFAALGGALALRGLTNTLDQLQLLDARLRLVTDDVEGLRGQLFDLSQETRTSLEGTTELFIRVGRARQELGLGQQELLDLTRTINQAIQISGASAQEATAGVIQLSQALQSGRLGGDEFRSVLEQLPRVAEAIAQGLDTNVAGLFELRDAGLLTAESVTRALLRMSDVIESEFASVGRTTGQAFQQLENAFLRSLGAADEATSATARFVDALDRLRAIVESPGFQRGIQFVVDAISAITEQIAAEIGRVGRFVEFIERLGEGRTGQTLITLPIPPEAPEVIERAATATADFAAATREATVETRSLTADLESEVAALRNFVERIDEGSLSIEEARRQYEAFQIAIDRDISFAEAAGIVDLNEQVEELRGRLEDPGGLGDAFESTNERIVASSTQAANVFQSVWDSAIGTIGRQLTGLAFGLGTTFDPRRFAADLVSGQVIQPALRDLGGQLFGGGPSPTSFLNVRSLFGGGGLFGGGTPTLPAGGVQGTLVPAPTGFLGLPTGTFGAAGLGALGGGLIGSQFGGQGGLFGGGLGGLGAGAGFALGGPIGGVAGGLIGSVAGGALGGLFGGGSSVGPVSVARGGLFGGQFRVTDSLTDNAGDAAASIAVLEQAFGRLAAVTQALGLELASATEGLDARVEILQESGDINVRVNGLIADFTDEMEAAEFIIESLIPEVGGLQEAMEEFGITTEQLAGNLEDVAATVQLLTEVRALPATIEELRELNRELTPFEQALADVNTQFDSLVTRAEELALGTEILADIESRRAVQLQFINEEEAERLRLEEERLEAERRANELARQQSLYGVREDIDRRIEAFGEGNAELQAIADLVNGLDNELRRLGGTTEDFTRLAELENRLREDAARSTQDFTAALASANQQLLAANDNARSFFETLLGPLVAAERSLLGGEQALPASQRLAAVRADFEATRQAALAGDIGAIQALPGVVSNRVGVETELFGAIRASGAAQAGLAAIQATRGSVEGQRNALFAEFNIPVVRSIDQQTAALVTEIRALREEFERIEREMRLNRNRAA